MTFQAKRTYSSGEYLALKRQEVDRQLTRPPSINLQDSSELTARIRKHASVPYNLYPFQPSKGNSTNMVKWRDASVVQAMREGAAYRTATNAYVPHTDINTIKLAPNQFLTCTQGDGRFPTAPKAIPCTSVFKGEVRVPQAFNLQEHFGMRKNDNKVVMFNAPAFHCTKTGTGTGGTSTFSYTAQDDDEPVKRVTISPSTTVIIDVTVAGGGLQSEVLMGLGILTSSSLVPVSAILNGVPTQSYSTNNGPFGTTVYIVVFPANTVTGTVVFTFGSPVSGSGYIGFFSP